MIRSIHFIEDAGLWLSVRAGELAIRQRSGAYVHLSNRKRVIVAGKQMGGAAVRSDRNLPRCKIKPGQKQEGGKGYQSRNKRAGLFAPVAEHVRTALELYSKKPQPDEMTNALTRRVADF